MVDIPEKFDGIYFTPPSKKDMKMKYTFFELVEEFAGGVKIDHNFMGDTWIILLIHDPKPGKEKPKYKENFEAIIGDPMEYIKNLIGSNLYGCAVRKTDKSLLWFDEYSKKMIENFK